ncbi:MAG: TonB family protein [Pseudomonadota bacterium]
MRTLLSGLGLGLGLALASFFAYAGDAEKWGALMKESRALVSQKQYSRALEPGRQAFAIAERELGGDVAKMASSLTLVASIYQIMGQPEQAEADFLHALALQQKQIPPDVYGMAWSQIQLANLNEQKGEHAKAESLLSQVIAAVEKHAGPESGDLILPLAILGKVYLNQGRNDLAEPVLMRGLTISEQSKSRFGWQDLFSNVAELYRKTGREDQARTMEKRAVEAVNFVPTPTPVSGKVAAGMDFSVCKPSWPREALRYEMQGTVQMQLLVDVDGQVIKAQVAKSSGWKLLDDATVGAMTKCTVRPATRDGKPAQVWALTNYVWKLEDSGPQSLAPELIRESCLPTERFTIARPDEMDSVIYLYFSVAPDGKPYGVRVNFGSMNPLVDMAAVQFASNCRYQSAVANGSAAYTPVTLRLHWNKS